MEHWLTRKSVWQNPKQNSFLHPTRTRQLPNPTARYWKNTKAEVEASGVSWLGQELAAALKHLIKEKYSLLKCSLLQPWRYNRASWLAAASSAHICCGEVAYPRLKAVEGQTVSLSSSADGDQLPCPKRKWEQHRVKQRTS